MARMHADEVPVDAALARRLLAEQLPEWAELPLAGPLPLAEGAPARGYPFTWSVYRWLPGENATADRSRTSGGWPATWHGSSRRCSGSTPPAGLRRAT